MRTLIKRRYTATVPQSFPAAAHSGAHSFMSQPHMTAGACMGRVAANAEALADRTCQDSRPSTSTSHAPLIAPPDTHDSEEEPARVLRVQDSARLDGRPSTSSSHAPPTSSSCRAAARKVCPTAAVLGISKAQEEQAAPRTGRNQDGLYRMCVRACAHPCSFFCV